MGCEICGSEEAGYLILVEGAKLSVCRDCSTTGKLIRGPQPKPRSEEGASFARQEMEVAEGYGRMISEARKSMGLPLEVLAERINEKHSFLERVEHERTLPDGKLCKKLEKELGIKLLQEASEGAPVASSSPKGGITLGDILEIEMRKKKQK
jgi:putative transcription factor